MSRLPSSLQPVRPLVKRAHRYATRQVGSVTRRTTVLAGPRAVPRTGTDPADDTVAREPQAVRMHPGGAAEELHRPMPLGSRADHCPRFGTTRTRPAAPGKPRSMWSRKT